MAHAAGHGVVAVRLQRRTGLQQRLAALARVQQAACRAAAQLLRPYPEQAEGRRRGIEKAPIRAVPGNQVGGVLDDQPVQPPGRLAFAAPGARRWHRGSGPAPVGLRDRG
jgi:hypothetical protein